MLVLPAGEFEFAGHDVHPEMVAAALAYVPALHVVQAADPEAGLYEPGLQAEQVPPSGPV